MKPPQRVLDVTSTIEVAEDRRIKMGIDPRAIVHIQGILTDLYSDPEMAVLREYSTNGDDAHVDANVSLPIEVTLPTNLSPYLKIRDFGKGLNIDDIREIYSLYGASTKRDTNDQVGSLGLGCKSALTYTDQFTLQGIKDGIATQVAISRDEDGGSSMTVVAEYPTDEASGVEITIPSKANNDFEGKAEYLFQFWPEGRVLVNGEEPQRIEGIELEEGLLVVPTDKLDHSVVVMGNVPYPFRNDDQQHFSVVANVAMGAVQFVPSREELQMTTLTKNVIADIGTKVANLKETAAQRIVDEAKSKPEALVAALYASRLFHYNGDLTYNGKSIPTEIRTQAKENDFLIYKTGRTYYRERSVSAEEWIPTSIFPNTIFFTGFTNKGLNPAQREKISLYLSEKRIDTSNIQQYVMLDELRCSTWVEKERIIEWEEIKATKLPKQNQSGRPAGAYDVIKPGEKYTEVLEAADMEGAKHIFWFPYNLGLESRIRDLLQTEYPDCYLVMLKENRVAKFERMFPQAKKTGEGARDVGQAWFDKLTEDERMFLSVRKMSDHAYFAQLDETKLDDPKLQTIVRLAKQTNRTLQEEAARFTHLYQGEVEADTEAYPLLSLHDLRYMHDDKKKALYLSHLYLYLNAVYAASQGVTQTPTTDDDEKENS